MPFALLPSVGPPELFLFLFTLLFYGGVIWGVVHLFRQLAWRSKLEDTVADLVEENRRLRAQVGQHDADPERRG